MIKHFKDELDMGKLYISYPMVEAVKYLKKDSSNCLESCSVKAKVKIKFKKVVNDFSADYQDLTKLTKNCWNYIIGTTYSKANCLIHDVKSLPKYEVAINLKQNSIFIKQKEHFIDPHERVLVLSAFPFFIVEYLGEDFYKEITS